MKEMFSPPKEWENWLNLAFGFWLFFSPWLLQFSGLEASVTNATISGLLITTAEVFTFSALGALEELIDLVPGSG